MRIRHVAMLLVVPALAAAGCEHPIDALDKTGPGSLIVTSISPSAGSMALSTNVRIQGRGFQSGATVTVGSAATDVNVASASNIFARVRSDVAGWANVVVTNPDGSSATLASAFLFQPPSIPTGASGTFVPTPAVAPSSATDPAVGRYTLNVSVGGCPAIPAYACNRTYVADVEPRGDGAYFVTLSGASFLHGLTCTDSRFPPVATPICNRFLASRSGDSMQFDFMGQPDDNFNGNLIYELLPDSTWVEMGGSASGLVQPGGITATGQVGLSHWSGFPGLGSTYKYCNSTQLQMVFSSSAPKPSRR